MNPKIFISYRRADAAYVASTISDRLAARFGRDSVLLDVGVLTLGASFKDSILGAIRGSTIVLAVIGPAWGSKTADGRRRIDDPGDFVRLELEAAFDLGIPVIPVLVGGAVMPSAAELPSGLQQLARNQAAEIRSGRDIAENTDRLVQAIEQFVREGNPTASVLREPIRARPIVQPPPLTPSKMGRPTGTVFISYRREGGAETARLIRYELRARGWQVFLDVEDLKSGHFDEELLAEVTAADNFLLILSKGALKECADEGDWLRREIRTAINTKRNVVPLLKENTRPPGEEHLPADIELVGTFNCVDYSHVYYDATIDRLLSFLRKRAV